jgi:hypothetical protein
VAEAVVIAQAIILNLVLANHVLLLAPIALLIHVLHALVTHVRLATHVLHALVTHVLLLVPVLLNPKLVVNVETLAAAKNDSPFSPPFCMESSRFR